MIRNNRRICISRAGLFRIAVTLLSVVLLVWLIHRQNWNQVYSYIFELDSQHLVSALLLITFGQVMYAIRWTVLLRGLRLPVSWRQSFRLTFSGLFASNFLPTTVGGDVVRITGAAVLVSRKAKVVASVMVDRLISLFSMAFLLPFSISILSLPTAASLSAVASVGTDKALPQKWVRRLKVFFAELWQAIESWRSKPVYLFLALVISWSGMFFYLLATWITATGLGISVSMYQVAGVTGITYFLTLLPISINSYGIRELGMAALYISLGANQSQALGLAILTRLMLMVSSLPGSLWLGSSLSIMRQVTTEDLARQ